MAMQETNGIDERGDRLSIFSNKEAISFLDDYEDIIFFECRKRSYIPGLDIHDLMQECRIRLLAGYHKYDKRKQKEKTWVRQVIVNTLNGIWNHAVKTQRACYVPNEDGEEKPVYNFSLDSFYEEKTSNFFEESYTGSSDGRPAFATTPESPEENLALFQILEHLKFNLMPDAYEYIKTKLFPEDHYKEILELEKRFRKELLEEGFSHLRDHKEYKVFCVLSSISIEEAEILKQVAEVMINDLGFSRKDIYEREDMVGFF